VKKRTRDGKNMAKAMVKCGKCGQIFDRNSPEIPNEKIKNRYFHIEKLTPKINMQIKKYMKEYGYSYEGIEYCVRYFFIIKENSIDKAQGGIGIVPYIYEEAKQYYLSQQAIEQKAEKLDNILNLITHKTIQIKLPKPKPAKNFTEIINMKEL
jgi:hypothetical protein